MARDLSQLCERLRIQFPSKLFDLRMRHYGYVAGCYQPEGTSLNNDLTTAPQHDIVCLQNLLGGVATAALCQAGTLIGEAPIGEYLPELVSNDPHSPGRRIKVRDLLTHSTGYRAPNGIASKAGFSSWDHVVSYLKNNREAFPAGTVCSWSGLGRSLLLPIVRRVTGKPLQDVISELLCQPIGVHPFFGSDEWGWSSALFTLNDLLRVLDCALSPGGAASGLPEVLSRDAVPVVRRPISGRSGNPVAYSWGVAQFADGLWGYAGDKFAYSIGVRFDPQLRTLAGIVLGSRPYARDLILQYIGGACGYMRNSVSAQVIGSVVDCSPADLAGTYLGDVGDEVEVTVTDRDLSFEVRRGGVMVTRIPITLGEDNSLIGDSRWNAFQFEFFPHPETGSPCLMLGQIAYSKSGY